MVYQFSEKNQIFIALFAIVVLCAGKLFKDYLFRQGYIEGMTNQNFISSVTSTEPLSRPSGSTTTAFTIYFRIIMPNNNSVIKVLLPNDIVVNSVNDVTLSATASEYTIGREDPQTQVFTAIGLDSNSPQPVYTAASPRSISFTASNPIGLNTIVRIGVPGVLHPKASQVDSNETFGPFKIVIGSSDSSALSDERSITITPNGRGGGGAADTTSTSAVEIQKAINSIRTRLNAMASDDPGRDELLQAQSALVTVLAYTYGTVKEVGKVLNSDSLYKAQQTAIEFIKKEKARAASNASTLKEDNSNKRRMAQVNTYYTRNYEANIEVMKNIIFLSVALILLAVLRNKDLLPPSISTLGVIFVLTLGGIVIGQQVFDIIRRNDHDFDKYDWNFNEKEYNDKNFIPHSSDTLNLSDMGTGMAPCYGPGCCDVGTTWNPTAKKCMPGAGGSVSGSAVWTAASGGTLTIKLIKHSGLAPAASSPPPNADTVTITLPSGLFTGTPVNGSAGEFSINASPTVSAPLIFTKVTNTITTDTETPIIITGLAVSATANSASRTLKVNTSKDINTVGINITGIQ
jgi:hypothetical protein